MAKSEDQAFLKLRQHLDKQAVGFPAVKSGAEIRILKHIFSPREAEIAACLDFKLEPLEIVFERAKNIVSSTDALAEALDGIEKKGGIEIRIKEGKKHYRNVPLVLGMYEYQVGRLTPEFLSSFEEYTRDKKFGLEILATKLPQMRTIPVGVSISPQNQVSTFDQATALIEKSEGPFIIMECICRKKNAMLGKPCKVTSRKESCLIMGGMATSSSLKEAGREIPRAEAFSIIEHSQKDGLVLQPSNTSQADFICSCCGCCCGYLTMLKSLPRPVDFVASNFQAVVDEKLCDGCGTCMERCQVGAASVAQETPPARVNLNRCIGCGLCVAACPTNALSLKDKPVKVTPPNTHEELYEEIMAKKMGAIGKLKLFGKITIDSIRAR